MLCILFLSLTGNMFSKCRNGGLSFWPSGNTLHTNSIIMIEGFSGSQEIIQSLNTKYPVYLFCGEKRVKLKVKELCVGQMSLTQALLTPEEPLSPGLEYQLGIDSLSTEADKPSELLRWNADTTQMIPVKWKVVMETDTVKPLWLKPPRVIKKELVYFGCGPQEEVIFSCELKDASEVLVKTVVHNLRTDVQTTYYLEPRRNKLKVGHEMCSGAFRFIKHQNYEVTFTLTDSSGNTNSWKEKPISFSPPVIPTSWPEE